MIVCEWFEAMKSGLLAGRAWNLFALQISGLIDT